MGIKLPKLVLDNIPGDPLEEPEWSDQFLSTVDEAAGDDNVKMKRLETLLTGKVKFAFQGTAHKGR